MKVNISNLINKSPKQLSDIKRELLSVFNFEAASEVQDYIKHCIDTSRIVKTILRGQN